MTDKVIEYKSAEKEVSSKKYVLETINNNGIFCIWAGTLSDDYSSLILVWTFDWLALKKKGVCGLTGFINVKHVFTNSVQAKRIDFELKDGAELVKTDIQNPEKYLEATVTFDYHLTPIYTQKVSYDEMFAASDKTDAILVIEGKKVHVSKVFLSYHSDFFTALFSSNFKEGQMTEIPIKDVSYEDFGLLMSTIYPKQVFPNDRTAEKLLELADRFLMPFITRQVEHHLLKNSNLGNEKLIWMADAYGMPELLEKTIRAMDTVEKAKVMQKSEEYKKLSFETRSKLFDRITQFV